jgi:hypothetical protein
MRWPTSPLSGLGSYMQYTRFFGEDFTTESTKSAEIHAIDNHGGKSGSRIPRMYEYHE